MNLPALVVIVCTAVGLATLFAALFFDGHPEDGCEHGTHPLDTINEMFYRGIERPAGPDAEDAALERDRPPP